MTLTLFILLLLGLVAIAYQQKGAMMALIWTALMLLIQQLSDTSTWLSAITLLSSLILALFAIKPLRTKLLIGPIFKAFKKALPKMSQTERDALESGTVWWDGELFSGKPDWQRLLATPKPELSAEEQAFIDGPVNTLCAMIDDWQATHHQHDLSAETWAYLKSERFFGIVIPKAYGGLEFSALAHSSIVTQIATRSISAAVTVMVPNSLGPGELLQHYGTDEQKQHFLPRLAIGEEIPCFALTGPEAGSDAASLTDTGIVCEQTDQSGNKTLGIRITWNKRYITLAPVATILGLAFDLQDPDHLLGDEEAVGITCALIPTNLPGVEIGERHFPLNGVFMNGPTRGNDVFIPLDWIIGGAEYAGKGWRMLMESLAAGRCISLPALSVGGAQLAARATGSYARLRRQFNLPIGRFEGIEEPLARIGGYAYQMNAARIMTAGALDQGESPSVLSAILKYHLTERLRITINDAMDIQGGSGICLGHRNLFGRAYQTIPIAITVEGANILTRSLIIFGQGAMRAHPTLFKEVEAARNDQQAVFDEAFMQHLGLIFGNSSRAFVLGITNGRFSTAPDSDIKHYYRSLNRMSAAFAICADITLALLGGALKRKERLSARLGDALSQLYLASATLKQFHDDNEPEADLPLVDWAMQKALHDAQTALSGVLQNYPRSLIGKLLSWKLRWLIFPLGARYKAPSDRLDHQVADLLLTPNEARNRLTQQVYLGADAPSDNSQIAKLETALNLTLLAEPIEAKIRQQSGKKAMTLSGTQTLVKSSLAANIIDKHEAAQLLAAAEARNDIIQVDAFQSLDTVADDPIKQETPYVQ